MKAVIETGGKQYYVEEGTVLYVEKLDVESGSKIKFDKVLMVNGVVGHPYLSNVEVTGEVVKHGKSKKIKVYKYNAKKNYHKTQGHRQPYTKVEITNIKTASAKAEDKAATETKTASAKPATKKADTAKKEA